MNGKKRERGRSVASSQSGQRQRTESEAFYCTENEATAFAGPPNEEMNLTW